MSERDPALDHAGRFASFLNRTIKELKPVDENAVTVIQPNKFKESDDLVPSLTGAGALADGLMRRIAAAKARSEAANAKVEGAFVKLDSAAVALEDVAKKVEAEADAALAKIGQVSNGAPT